MILSLFYLPREIRDLVYDYVFEGLSVDVYEARSGACTLPPELPPQRYSRFTPCECSDL